VTFGSAWALGGLILLVPLVALYLRSRGQPPRVVSSLLLWRQLDSMSTVGTRGRHLSKLPLLFLLQALVVIFLVVALAEPSVTGALPRPGRVVVVDDSLWMSAPGKLTTARHEALGVIRAAGHGTPVAIVVAGGDAPQMVYRGGADGANRALNAIRPTAAPSDLAAALAVAAGALGGRSEHVYLIRAPEDSVPQVDAAGDGFTDRTVGTATADQGIFDPSARCGVGSANTCEVYATAVNGSSTLAVDSYTAQTAGQPELTGTVTLEPNASAQIALLTAPGDKVVLGLRSPDEIPSDDKAVVAVPGVGGVAKGTAVTLVGTRARSLSIAQALVATPGITLQLATPTTYRTALARKSAVVIYDGWLPAGGLPPAAATVLIDPPRVPGGHAGRALSDSVVTGTDQASPLLTGVDLNSLAIGPGSGHALSLPTWLTPAAWSASGPVIAAGDDGSERLAVLSFEPGKSNLPQLSSFPVLIANIVSWASRWAPGSASLGEPITVDATPGARAAVFSLGGDVVSRVELRGHPVAFTPQRPGFYTVTETGPGVSRSLTIAASAETPTQSARAVDFRASVDPTERGAPTSLALWFLVAAFVVMAGEGLYWVMRRTSVVA
jgi:Aerotolerance regulator N-terminal